MEKIKLLYVEDELSLAGIVRDVLESRNYEVRLVSDGAKVLMQLDDFQPDICVLDIMLPNLDGYTLASEIRKRIPDTPIIFLSAKNQAKDVIKGFHHGGNDYLRKPFSIEELLVRMENQLKQSRQTPQSTVATSTEIPIGSFTFLPKKLLLAHGEEVRRLTNREAELLEYFARFKNDVIVKKDLLLQLWGDDNLYNARNLDVYITKLRDFFADDPQVEIITLRGVGYRFNVEKEV
jgi:two-component system response regulator VicR